MKTEKFNGEYTLVTELSAAQLEAPMSAWKTTRDQSIVKAARQSIKNGNQVHYVEVTYTKVFWGTTEPAFNTGHYRVTGNKVEKYTPKFG